jgi:hypothetical protein
MKVTAGNLLNFFKLSQQPRHDKPGMAALRGRRAD